MVITASVLVGETFGDWLAEAAIVGGVDGMFDLLHFHQVNPSRFRVVQV